MGWPTRKWPWWPPDVYTCICIIVQASIKKESEYGKMFEMLATHCSKLRKEQYVCICIFLGQRLVTMVAFTDTILWIRRVLSQLFIEWFVLAIFSHKV
jgi:hypothetical protein